MRTLFLLALFMTTLCLAGCGGQEPAEGPDTTDPSMTSMPGDEK